MSYIFVYVTTPTVEEARKIGTAVVEARLAACANILPQMESIYHWAGKVQKAGEAVLLLKTRDDLFEKVRDFVLGMHPYDCPCVVSLVMKQGSEAYFEWIDNSLKA